MRRPLWLIVALGFGFSPPAQNSDDAKRFVGSWRLVSIDFDGERNPMWGPKPIGVIYYDTLGNMAVQIMPDRERPSWKQNESPTPEQAVDALSGYVAYFGTYRSLEAEMKLSARNVIKGKVKRLTPGAVNSEVVVELPGGTEIVSIVTAASATALGLTPGNEVYAVIKASNLILATD
jgi:molybdopterin-binding protein